MVGQARVCAIDIYALYNRLSRHFRTRRMNAFVHLFGIVDGTTVVDIGGGPFNWTLIARKPRVIAFNLIGKPRIVGNVVCKFGDARALPVAAGAFDVAFSNSVIEHVGDWQAIQAFAREVRRVAPRYYVQTPNRWFFVEPHLLAVFIHWLPTPWAVRLMPWLSLRGWAQRRSRAQTEAFLRGIKLLTVKEMRELFPDATIRRERFLGMTKSIIAIRT
ncbi:MAG: methyltransferase domain-containing protein [Rhizomicrobium sp.]